MPRKHGLSSEYVSSYLTIHVCQNILDANTISRYIRKACHENFTTHAAQHSSRPDQAPRNEIYHTGCPTYTIRLVVAQYQVNTWCSFLLYAPKLLCENQQARAIARRKTFRIVEARTRARYETMSTTNRHYTRVACATCSRFALRNALT